MARAAHEGPDVLTRLRAGAAATAAAIAVALGGCGGVADDEAQRAEGPELTVKLDVKRSGDGGVTPSVPIHIRGKGPYRFVLDTGASHSLIRKELAADLGLDASGPSVPVAGVQDVGRGQAVEVGDWRVDDVDLRERRLVATKLNRGDGILAADVLSEFGVVALDYDREVLLLRSDGLSGGDRAGDVKLDVVRRPAGGVQALVPVVVRDGGPHRFVLDTGATNTLVDARIVKQQGVPLTGARARLTGAVGTGAAPVARLRRWRAGDIDLPAGRVIAAPFERDAGGRSIRGLLGSDVLAQFGRVAIDFAGKRLIVADR